MAEWERRHDVSSRAGVRSSPRSENEIRNTAIRHESDSSQLGQSVGSENPDYQTAEESTRSIQLSTESDQISGAAVTASVRPSSDENCNYDSALGNLKHTPDYQVVYNAGLVAVRRRRHVPSWAQVDNKEINSENSFSDISRQLPETHPRSGIRSVSDIPHVLPEVNRLSHISDLGDCLNVFGTSSQSAPGFFHGKRDR